MPDRVRAVRGLVARYRAWVIVAAVVLALGVLNLPTTTSIGVNYVETTQRLPLYQKALAFVDRDIQTRRVAATVVAGLPPSEGARALGILAWAHQNVRPRPAGFPAVDDHIFHTIVRGYGDVDQAADVFATIADYAGIPATLIPVYNANGNLLYAFAYAFVDGDWRVFDVRAGTVIRDRTGELASVSQLRADAELGRGLPMPAESGVDYTELFKRLPEPLAPDDSRAADQRPFNRLWREIVRNLAR